MATAKKPVRKRKIQASEIEVANRTLEGVLMDLAERSARAEERSARAEEMSARAEQISARAEQMAAEAAQKSQFALEAIGALLRDLHALTLRTDDRLAALEQAAAE
jgi:hypothetical protein